MLLLRFLLLGLLVSAPAAPPARAHAAPQAQPAADALPGRDAWQAKIARDRRISFTPRTASDARGALALEGRTSERRAAAWIALGSAGATVERPRMEELARSGTGIEREAAILALGELG